MSLKGRIKVRRLAVDRLTSAPTKGRHIFASRAEQETHAQLQVSAFTTSCSLLGEKAYQVIAENRERLECRGKPS